VALGLIPILAAMVVFVLLGPLTSVVHSVRLAAVLAVAALMLVRRILFLWNVVDAGMLAGNERLGGRAIVVVVGTLVIWVGLYRAWPFVATGKAPQDAFETLSHSLLLLGGAVIYYAGLVWVTSGTIAALANVGPSTTTP
jgi:hypothetical protein